MSNYILLRPNNLCYDIAAENEEQAKTMAFNEDNRNDVDTIVYMGKVDELFGITSIKLDEETCDEIRRVPKIKNKIEKIAYKLIPEGSSCWGSECYGVDNGVPIIEEIQCPFWKLVDEDNAYCSYLCRSDKDEGNTGLMWDGVKECGIKCIT